MEWIESLPTNLFGLLTVTIGLGGISFAFWRYLEQKFDRFGDKIDKKFEEIDRKIDKKFEEIDRRIDYKVETITGRVDHKFEEIDRRTDHRFERFEDRIDRQFEQIRELNSISLKERLLDTLFPTVPPTTPAHPEGYQQGEGNRVRESRKATPRASKAKRLVLISKLVTEDS